MAGHTKGPWRAYPAGSSVPHYDVCDRIVSDRPSGRCASEGPSDADAALIAAAPELLEALRGLIPLVEMDDDASDPRSDLWAALHLAREAVRKAEGQ